MMIIIYFLGYLIGGILTAWFCDWVSRYHSKQRFFDSPRSFALKFTIVWFWPLIVIYIFMCMTIGIINILLPNSKSNNETHNN